MNCDYCGRLHGNQQTCDGCGAAIAQSQTGAIPKFTQLGAYAFDRIKPMSPKDMAASMREQGE